MVRIRQARADDRDAITAVHVASVRNVEPSVYDEAALAVWEAGAESAEYAITDDATAVPVAEHDDRLVGFAEASAEAAELAKLYVDPAWQGRGVGRALAEAVEESLRRRGVDSLFVEASLNAAPFYEHVGFERRGTHEKTVADDSTTSEMTMVDLEKTLR
jgi:predicted N-acetyltransferase YhbS